MVNVLVTYYNNQTWEEFKNSDKQYLGHFNKVHKFKKDDIVLLLNNESKHVEGIAVLGEYEDGKVYREHHALDVDVHAGEHSKYNKYEIKIENLKFIHISFEDLATLCGKDEDDKSITNIWKAGRFNYSNVFYKGEDEDLIMLRLNIFIHTILTSK